MTSRKASSGNNRDKGADVQQLHFNLQQSCSLLFDNTRQFLRPYKITPKQYSILNILANGHPASYSIQDIRNHLADKMSDASRLLDRLDKKNFIEKFPSDFDRRSNRVRITDKGLKLLEHIKLKKPELDRFVNERLDEQEIHQLNTLLQRLK